MAREYVVAYSPYDRKRHSLFTERGRIVRFVVQYETYTDGRWKPVVRHDNFYTQAHRDSYGKSGKRLEHRQTIPCASLPEALDYAHEDLDRNWKRYREVFEGS